MSTRSRKPLGFPEVSEPEPSSNRLESWKEIAAYLKRDERTLRRWEKAEGLPIHRHRHHKRDTVYAYPPELDVWWKNGQARLDAMDKSGVGRQRRLRWWMVVGLALLAAIPALNVGGLRDSLWRNFGTRPAAGEISTLAVLPLKNLTGDPAQEYFAEGMTEELIAEISKISGLKKVVSRTSVMQYKNTNKAAPQIAQELGVDGLIEGSVSREGDGVRITVQLIHGPSDRHLWSRSFDRELRAILELRSEVARAIAAEIRVKVTPEEQVRLPSVHPVNPEAYELYLRARFIRYHRRALGLREGNELLHRALKIDATYAVAWAELALANASLSAAESAGIHPRQLMLDAKEAVLRALELDGTLAEAHIALGLVKSNYDWDWAAAEKEFKRALELNPSSADGCHWYAHLLTAMGRFDEALQLTRRGLQLDPLSPVMHVHLAWHYLFTRQYDRALEQARKLAELRPDERNAYHHMARVFSAKGLHEQAQALKAVDVSKRNRDQLATLGLVYAVAEKRPEALQVVNELVTISRTSYVNVVNLAGIHAALGNFDESFAWLEKAYADRAADMTMLNVDSRFDRLRANPRFQALLRRMNFPR